MHNKNDKYKDMSSLDSSLLINYLEETTTVEETLQVEKWINENEENRKEIEQIAEIYFTKRAYDRMKSRRADLAFQKNQFLLRQNKKNTWLKRTLYFAASFIGTVIIVSTYIYLYQPQNINRDIAYIEIKANPGVKTQVVLPDETIVQLNSGSKLSYPEKFSEDYRYVQLEGEAFFQVKEDKTKPFIVNTKDGRASVEVLGTSFNIQAFTHDNEFTTTLVQGAVNVMLKHANGVETAEQLLPSYKLTFNKDTDSISVLKVDTDIETAWLTGSLIFRDLPMAQVLKILSYNYDVDFEIKNPAIYSYHFTGTFQNRQLNQILEYLKISSDIDYTIIYPDTDDSFGINKTKVILN